MTIDTADLRELSLAEAAEITGLNPRTLKGLWCDIPTAWKTPGGQYRVALWGIAQWQRERSAVSPAGVIEGSRSSGHVDAPAGGIATSEAAEELTSASSRSMRTEREEAVMRGRAAAARGDNERLSRPQEKPGHELPSRR